ncbi:MAG TPA: TVP38/TMEM64 family protein [Candidatus Binataceae bacterium]|nr:TVP38/TMEM64 family protein [Candidatus Binataceae bacterium]
MRAILQPKVILLIVAIGALIALGRYFHLGEVFAATLDRIRDLGAIAPVVFIALYIIGAVLFIPGSILTIGAGVVFGLVRGAILVSIGATIGAIAAFLIGRYFAREWVRGQLEGNPRFAAIDKAVGREGWKIVLLTRLSPVFPFNLLNYAFGLTAVTLRDYALATWIGMTPGIVLYVYIGAIGGNLASAGGSHRSPAQWALNVVGLAATVAVAVYASRIASRALKENAALEANP